ncbi:MAG: HAD-IA family hydrolase [Duncaniella sp.]|nr:HAD-IA family hydrolase [Duncaniella sp.]
MKSDTIPPLFTAGVSWVWFDLDDTLIDFHANSRAAHRILFDECSLHRFYPTPESWIEAYEGHNHKLWERYNRQEITQDFLRLDRFYTPLRGKWEGSDDELEAFSREMDPIYLTRLAEQKTLIPGAAELLEFLRAHNYNIGVLSNGFTSVQHAKLRTTGLDRLVDLTVLSDDIGINKPDIRLYRHAMERAGDTSPGHHLMIGDNPDTDIRGALDSQWRAIHLDRTSQGTPRWLGTHLLTPDLPSVTGLF